MSTGQRRARIVRCAECGELVSERAIEGCETCQAYVCQICWLSHDSDGFRAWEASGSHLFWERPEPHRVLACGEEGSEEQGSEKARSWEAIPGSGKDACSSPPC